ncbi:MAG: hypothetical protein RIG84_05790 [Roseovarius sp.]
MPYDRVDWASCPKGEQLELARTASRDELRRLARDYDWRSYPEPVLTWIMAQKTVDLGTALTVFFNGEPERFNYLSKREVPEAYIGAARALDNICLRVNSGFYLVAAGQKVANRVRLEKWLDYQQADRAEGRQGRWILDERIVEGALKPLRPVVTGETMPDIAALKPVQGAGAVQAFLREVLSRVLPGR